MADRLNLKRMVPVAVDRAVADIITPVVERSVTIACMTTQELILKVSFNLYEQDWTSLSHRYSLDKTCDTAGYEQCSEFCTVSSLRVWLRNTPSALALANFTS